MIKCIFREMEPADLPHCNKEAEYIFLGKSYCPKHLKIRSKEMMEKIEKRKNEIT